MQTLRGDYYWVQPHDVSFVDNIPVRQEADLNLNF